MQRHRILVIALFALTAITCCTTGFPLLADKRLQSCCQQHCSVDRISHFERPLVRRLSLAANAQHGNSDSDEAPSSQEENASTETQPTRKNISTGRAGGRVSSSSRRVADARPSAGDSGSSTLSLGKLAFPLLAAWLFLQMLFGGIGGLISPGSYVFYQSSVYESRVYTPDGKVETRREESIRSNLPSLVERQATIGQSSPYQSKSKGYLSPSSQLMNEADDEFDRALKDMMREKF
jgi:hypothetical protein